MAANKITIKFNSQGERNLLKALKNLAKAQDELTRNTKKFGKVQDNTRKGGRLLNNAFATMRSKLLLLNFAMAMGVKQLIGFAKEAAKVESMSRAFTTLSGGASNASIAIGKLQVATNNTMSEFDLFQQANNAMVLGITKNSDEMAEMFDVAQRLGRALGKDTAHSVESLITGIGRQSRLMLDNIGIIVKADEAYERYAQKLGTTADKLSDADKKTAFLEATMESARAKVASLGAETLSSQDSFDAFSATMKDLSVLVGNKLKGAFAGAMDAFVKFVEISKSADTTTAIASGSFELMAITVERIEHALKESERAAQNQAIAFNAGVNIYTLSSEKVKELRDDLIDLKFAMAEAYGFTGLDEPLFDIQSTDAAILGVNIMAEEYRKIIDPLEKYNIKLAETSNITADYSDNLDGLSRAFKISAMAQEQQKNAIVSSSFATGMAYDNAGKAAEAAGKQVIQSLIQQAVVTLMADAVKKLGWFGVPLAATAGAVVGSLVGQAGRHWKMEDGGLVGGRRHSQGGTIIEAEQGEFVMSRNAVNAVGVEAMNRINQGGGAGAVNISFSGNVMSQDFIEDEAIPMIKEAIRRGADIGVS